MTLPTVADVDAMLAQLQTDRLTPYWSDRLDQLDGVQSWLESLRDHLDSDQASPHPLWVEGSLVAAGGWCAPTSTLYDAAALQTNDYTMVSSMFPVIKVLRPGTPEWDENQRKVAAQRLAETSLQTLVHRLIRNVQNHQDYAIEQAYAAAIDAGMDLLLEEAPFGHTMWRWDSPGAPPYRFIGLALVERSEQHWRRLQGDRPIIIREQASDGYKDWDDDWDDD